MKKLIQWLHFLLPRMGDSDVGVETQKRILRDLEGIEISVFAIIRLRREYHRRRGLLLVKAINNPNNMDHINAIKEYDIREFDFVRLKFRVSC